MSNTMTLRPERASPSDATVRVLRPRVDLIERDKEWTLIADLPGVEADAIALETEKGTLVLRAERKALPEPPAEGGRWLVRERPSGRYEARFRLGEGIDLTKIEAVAKDGVLVLHLPKTEALQPRRIAVRTT